LSEERKRKYQRCPTQRAPDWSLDCLRVWEQDLLELAGTPGPPRRVLVQLEELHPPHFAEDLSEIEKPRLGHDDGGLVERVALHFSQLAHGVRANRRFAAADPVSLPRSLGLTSC
jgi:hypothetical protein